MPIASELKSKWAATAVAAKATLAGEFGIYRRLMTEHAAVLSLMQAAEAAKDAATRADLFATIRRELASHLEAEEQEFYAVISDHPDTLECTQINVDEHRALAAIMTTLVHIEPFCAEWDELFGKLKTLFVSHVEREERELFQATKLILTDQQAKTLETQFSDGKAEQAKRLDDAAPENVRYVVPIP